MPATAIQHRRVRRDGSWRFVVVGPEWSTVPHQRPIPGGNLYGYIHRIPACDERYEGRFYGHDCGAPLRGWLVIAADGSRPYGETLFPSRSAAEDALGES